MLLLVFIIIFFFSFLLAFFSNLKLFDLFVLYCTVTDLNFHMKIFMSNAIFVYFTVNKKGKRNNKQSLTGRGKKL